MNRLKHSCVLFICLVVTSFAQTLDEQISEFESKKDQPAPNAAIAKTLSSFYEGFSVSMNGFSLEKHVSNGQYILQGTIDWQFPSFNYDYYYSYVQRMRSLLAQTAQEKTYTLKLGRMNFPSGGSYPALEIGVPREYIGSVFIDPANTYSSELTPAWVFLKETRHYKDGSEKTRYLRAELPHVWQFNHLRQGQKHPVFRSLFDEDNNEISINTYRDYPQFTMTHLTDLESFKGLQHIELTYDKRRTHNVMKAWLLGKCNGIESCTRASTDRMMQLYATTTPRAKQHLREHLEHLQKNASRDNLAIALLVFLSGGIIAGVYIFTKQRS